MRRLPAAVDGQRISGKLLDLLPRTRQRLDFAVCVSVQPSKPCMRTVTPSLLRKQLHLLEGWVVMM